MSLMLNHKCALLISLRMAIYEQPMLAFFLRLSTSRILSLFTANDATTARKTWVMRRAAEAGKLDYTRSQKCSHDLGAIGEFQLAFE